MSNRKQLQRIEVNSIFFDKIVEHFGCYMEYCQDIYGLFYGTQNKHKIYFNEEYVVIRENRFNYIHELLYNEHYSTKYTDWKQIVLRIDDTVERPVKTITGTQAFNHVKSILLKYYSEEEFIKLLNSYTEDYDYDKRQFIENYKYDKQYVVYKLTNCYKYDINKAYASLLIQMFPKAKKDLLDILKKSKIAKEKGNKEQSNIYKNYINYFVGKLKRLGYTGAYYHIVHTISEKVMKTILYLGGILVYSRTDSICIQDPKNILESSNEFGEFKLEYQGDVYFYADKNYVIYQFGDEYRGSCRKSVRDQFDLPNGKVVTYKNKRNNKIQEITDICIEKVNVVEL